MLTTLFVLVKPYAIRFFVFVMTDVLESALTKLQKARDDEKVKVFMVCGNCEGKKLDPPCTECGGKGCLRVIKSAYIAVQDDK